MPYLLTNCRVYTGYTLLVNHDVLVQVGPLKTLFPAWKQGFFFIVGQYIGQLPIIM
jgi:hypothetical protein